MQQKRTLDMQMIETLSQLNKNREAATEGSPNSNIAYENIFRNGMNSTGQMMRHSGPAGDTYYRP
jgi:hypothetical protein